MTLHHLTSRIARLREQALQRFPRKETGPDLADIGAVFVGEERLAYLAFISTIRHKFPGGKFTNEAIDVALDQMTQEEKATFRAWLVKAEQRKDSAAVIELENWRGW